MSKLLYVKANPKSNTASRTFRISEKFMETYRQSYPDDEIITLDLYKMGCQFLTEEVVTMHKPEPAFGREHPILKYAYQFKEVDKYVVAAPMWNLSIPAILKAYIDYVVVAGITFKYTPEGAVGLCQGKQAVYIVTRGGTYMGTGFEMGERYLRTIFGFLGITDFSTVSAEGLDIVGNDVEAIVEKASREAQEKAKYWPGREPALR
ncbi:MAG: FMN-dependent NADH-azoreductase [Endomicrobiales bacterium]